MDKVQFDEDKMRRKLQDMCRKFSSMNKKVPELQLIAEDVMSSYKMAADYLKEVVNDMNYQLRLKGMAMAKLIHEDCKMKAKHIKEFGENVATKHDLVESLRQEEDDAQFIENDKERCDELNKIHYRLLDIDIDNVDLGQLPSSNVCYKVDFSKVYDEISKLEIVIEDKKEDMPTGLLKRSHITPYFSDSLKPDSELEVAVKSHIDSKGIVWITTVKKSKELEILNSINNSIRRSLLNFDPPDLVKLTDYTSEPGSLCIVNNPDTRKWCRGLIESKCDDSTQRKVRLLDYGHLCTVNLSDLIDADVHASSHPYQSTCCSVVTEGDNWMQEVSARVSFNKLVESSTVKCRFLKTAKGKQGHWLINIFLSQDDGTTINIESKLDRRTERSNFPSSDIRYKETASDHFDMSSGDHSVVSIPDNSSISARECNKYQPNQPQERKDSCSVKKSDTYPVGTSQNMTGDINYSSELDLAECHTSSNKSTMISGDFSQQMFTSDISVQNQAILSPGDGDTMSMASNHFLNSNENQLAAPESINNGVGSCELGRPLTRGTSCPSNMSAMGSYHDHLRTEIPAMQALQIRPNAFPWLSSQPNQTVTSVHDISGEVENELSNDDTDMYTLSYDDTTCAPGFSENIRLNSPNCDTDNPLHVFPTGVCINTINTSPSSNDSHVSTGRHLNVDAAIFSPEKLSPYTSSTPHTDVVNPLPDMSKPPPNLFMKTHNDFHYDANKLSFRDAESVYYAPSSNANNSSISNAGSDSTINYFEYIPGSVSAQSLMGSIPAVGGAKESTQGMYTTTSCPGEDPSVSAQSSESQSVDYNKHISSDLSCHFNPIFGEMLFDSTSSSSSRTIVPNRPSFSECVRGPPKGFSDNVGIPSEFPGSGPCIRPTTVFTKNTANQTSNVFAKNDLSFSNAHPQSASNYSYPSRNLQHKEFHNLYTKQRGLNLNPPTNNNVRVSSDASKEQWQFNWNESKYKKHSYHGCYNCGLPDHWARECKEPKRMDRRTNNSEQRSNNYEHNRYDTRTNNSQRDPRNTSKKNDKLHYTILKRQPDRGSQDD